MRPEVPDSKRRKVCSFLFLSVSPEHICSCLMECLNFAISTIAPYCHRSVSVFSSFLPLSISVLKTKQHTSNAWPIEEKHRFEAIAVQLCTEQNLHLLFKYGIMIDRNAELDSLHVNISNGLRACTDERTDTNYPSESSFEHVLRRCGDFGRFQCLHFFFINLIAMSCGIVSFYYVFAAAEPNHRCRLPPDLWPNDTSYEAISTTHELHLNQSIRRLTEGGHWERCFQMANQTVTPCRHGWVYDRSIFGYTFTEEANLVCEQKAKKSWLATSMQCGGLSLLITGPLADRCGRKKIISIVSILLLVICLFSQILSQFVSFTPLHRFLLLLINQFASGLTMSTFALSFILMLELTTNGRTNLTANLAFLSFTLGEIWIAAVAYLTRDWQRLKWINTGFIALTIPYLYFMPESPLYLYSKGQHRQLERLLRRIAVINGRSASDWHLAYEDLIQCPSKHQVRPYTGYSWAIVIRLLVVVLLGVISLMLYYKSSYGLAAVTMSPYLSILIGAILEAVSYLTTSILISSKLGRKGSLIIMMSVTIFSLVCLPIAKNSHPLVTILFAQFGKYASSGTIAITWIFVPELFPTSIRSTTNGLVIASSRIGAILAPVIDTLFSADDLVYTNYAISIFALLVVLLCFVLPETKDRQLSE